MVKKIILHDTVIKQFEEEEVSNFKVEKLKTVKKEKKSKKKVIPPLHIGESRNLENLRKEDRIISRLKRGIVLEKQLARKFVYEWLRCTSMYGGSLTVIKQRIGNYLLKLNNKDKIGNNYKFIFSRSEHYKLTEDQIKLIFNRYIDSIYVDKVDYTGYMIRHELPIDRREYKISYK
jgi:hypothetical protein